MFWNSTAIASEPLPTNLEDISTHATVVRNAMLVDRTGKQYHLSQNSDQVLMVDQWANWCGPCLTELSFFKALSEKVGPNKLKIVLVTVDEKDWANDLKKFDAMGLPFDAVLYRPRNEEERLTFRGAVTIGTRHISELPTTTVFHPSGEVAAAFRDFEGDLSTLMRLFIKWEQG